MPEKLDACNANIHRTLRSRGLYQSGRRTALDGLSGIGFYTLRMNAPALPPGRANILGVLVAAALLAGACDGDKAPPDPAARVVGDESAAASAPAAPVGDVPDTSDMVDVVLAKINANPAIKGKATLVEFRQKSVSTQALGDTMKSAVVEFEGVVTFSSDVSWSWQGPTRAGEPQKFEARAEYVDQGEGWQRVEPLGIYPL